MTQYRNQFLDSALNDSVLGQFADPTGQVGGILNQAYQFQPIAGQPTARTLLGGAEEPYVGKDEIWDEGGPNTADDFSDVSVNPDAPDSSVEGRSPGESFMAMMQHSMPFALSMFSPLGIPMQALKTERPTWKMDLLKQFQEAINPTPVNPFSYNSFMGFNSPDIGPMSLSPDFGIGPTGGHDPGVDGGHGAGLGGDTSDGSSSSDADSQGQGGSDPGADSAGDGSGTW